MNEMDRFMELKEQADHGDADAMYQIALILLWNESGTGEPDPDRSAQGIKYLKAAIKAGNAAAMNQIEKEGRGILLYMRQEGRITRRPCTGTEKPRRRVRSSP